MLYSISITSDNETEQKRKKARAAAEAKSSGKKNKTVKNFVIPDLFKGCEFRKFNMKRISDAYVDNFVSSNRLLAKDHPHDIERTPAGVHLDFEEEKRLRRERDKDATTIIIAYSTNARKRKLFAFVDLMNRLLRGDDVKNDDPIFDQFNARCPKCGRVYTDQDRKICEHCTNQSAVFVRLMKYFGPFKLQLATVLICMVATSAIQLINPIISNQILYDQVISQPGVIAGKEVGTMHSEAWLYIMIGVVFAIAIVSLGISIIQNRANATMSTKVTLNMKLDIFTALQSLSLSFFNNNQTGRLITRVNYDADRIRSFFIDGVPNFVINALNFIGLTIFLFSLNWKLTLIVFIPVPIIVCIFKFMLPKLWRMYSKQWRRSSSLNAILGDSLTGIRVVKAFSKEAEETNRFYTYAEKLTQANLQVNLVSLTIFPLVGLLIGLSSQAIWGFGGIEVMNKNMTYGEFASYIGYIGMIFSPLNFFTQFTNMVTDTANCAQRMFEIVDAIPEITDAPDAVHLDRFKGDIKFENVCFHYAPNRPILKNVTMHINPGDHIGLVGHTGSGKSTIANLINRLYDTISGTISIDDINVKKIATETCVVTSRSSRRRSSSSAELSPIISAMPVPTPQRRRSSRPPRQLTHTTSSSVCPRATRQSSAPQSFAVRRRTAENLDPPAHCCSRPSILILDEADRGYGHRDRTPDPGRADRAHRGQDHNNDSAPALDAEGLQSPVYHRERRDRRGGNTRRAYREAWCILPPVYASERGKQEDHRGYVIYPEPNGCPRLEAAVHLNWR